MPDSDYSKKKTHSIPFCIFRCVSIHFVLDFSDFLFFFSCFVYRNFSRSSKVGLCKWKAVRFRVVKRKWNFFIFIFRKSSHLIWKNRKCSSKCNFLLSMVILYKKVFWGKRSVSHGEERDVLNCRVFSLLFVFFNCRSLTSKSILFFVNLNTSDISR